MPPYLNKLLTIAVFAFILLAAESVCFAIDETPSDKDLKRAEKVLTKLIALQTLSTNTPIYKATVNKSFPQLYISISGVSEGVLKTDLATAVFFYEKAYLAERDDAAAAAECDLEVREAYKNLCAARFGQTRAQLLHAKAGLHTDWATALLRYYRGDRDVSTISKLSDIDRERSIDINLAALLVAMLKTLDDEVNKYPSLAAFEERNAVAKVSYDKLSRDFESISPKAHQLLLSLPRNSLTYHLQNALNSYRDGLFWWQKTYRQKEMVVSVNNWTEPAPRNPLGFDTGTINYAVINTWRKAAKHISIAVVEIESARISGLNAGSIARRAL